jgi:pimeloyl-ACP methyl ester carboxylesterase
MRLPEGLTDVEAYADFVDAQVRDLNEYVLVGDSFGANVALAYAVRQPRGLEALVMSGGFAANPITNPFLKLRIWMASLLPGSLYRAVTLRFHVASLASQYDDQGQIPWNEARSMSLFRQNTPFRSYVARARAAFSSDFLDSLKQIIVPTLIITPSHDKLIGPKAAKKMLDGIPDAEEVVLARTGHMFRFSHPITYAQAIEDFLVRRGIGSE